MKVVKDEICNNENLRRWRLKYFPNVRGHEPEYRTKKRAPSQDASRTRTQQAKKPPPLPSRGSVAAEPNLQTTVCLKPAKETTVCLKPAEERLEARAILTPRYMTQPIHSDHCDEVVQVIRRRMHEEQQARGYRDQNISLTPCPERLPPPDPPQAKAKSRPKAPPPALDDQAPSQKKELGHILMEQVEERKIARKQAQMEAFSGQNQERALVLETLDVKIKEFRDDLLNIYDPATRNQRIKESNDLAQKLKEGIGPDWHLSAVSKDNQHRAQIEHLKQIGEEREAVHAAENRWIDELTQLFEPFRDGDKFNPIERLLFDGYDLPDFLRKALRIRYTGHMDDFTEDGFKKDDGSPNYTRILSKMGLIVLHPGFRGRKASKHDFDPDFTEDELDYGPMIGGTPLDWGTWWCMIGGFDPHKPGSVDSNGWTALMHACDSHFSRRAMRAASELLDKRNFDGRFSDRDMHEALNRQSTGSQPNGYSALHFACFGVSTDNSNYKIVSLLLDRKADIEALDEHGNTPLLHAAGTGLKDVCDLLIQSGCNKQAVTHDGIGAAQKALKSHEILSTHLQETHQVIMTNGVHKKDRHTRQSGIPAPNRQLRREANAAYNIRRGWHDGPTASEENRGSWWNHRSGWQEDGWQDWGGWQEKEDEREPRSRWQENQDEGKNSYSSHNWH